MRAGTVEPALPALPFQDDGLGWGDLRPPSSALPALPALPFQDGGPAGTVTAEVLRVPVGRLTGYTLAFGGSASHRGPASYGEPFLGADLREDKI
jgi:hypothetical protein